jgi:murein DD-endopeptidase MepM/ murein hydrolase activator NlpD
MFPIPKSPKISFGYGEHSHRYRDGRHKGVDFPAKVGTPVFAIAPGVVVHAGRNGLGIRRGWGRAYGIQVIVRLDRLPGTGPMGDYPSVYCGYMHLSRVKVKRGQRLDWGQVIGLSGNTGNTSGPHLHLELQKARYWGGWKGSVNPHRWLAAHP